MEKSAAETVKIISVKQTEIQAKEFLTINEASELLNVSRWTISRAIAAERLKAVRMGKRVIIRRKDIDELFTWKLWKFFYEKKNCRKADAAFTWYK